MFVRPGFGDALQDQIARQQRALHDMALAIAKAQASGQDAAAEQLRISFANLKTNTDALIRQQRARDNPSIFGVSLTPAGEILSQEQRDVKQAARDVIAARKSGLAPVLKQAVAALTGRAYTVTEQVEKIRRKETPSGFSLGLADLGASLQKLLPIFAVGVVAIVVGPTIARQLAGRRR